MGFSRNYYPPRNLHDKRQRKINKKHAKSKPLLTSRMLLATSFVSSTESNSPTRTLCPCSSIAIFSTKVFMALMIFLRSLALPNHTHCRATSVPSLVCTMCTRCSASVSIISSLSFCSQLAKYSRKILCTRENISRVLVTQLFRIVFMLVRIFSLEKGCASRTSFRDLYFFWS